MLYEYDNLFYSSISYSSDYNNYNMTDPANDINYNDYDDDNIKYLYYDSKNFIYGEKLNIDKYIYYNILINIKSIPNFILYQFFDKSSHIYIYIY